MAKQALGRGLDALLEGTDLLADAEPGIFYVNVESLQPNPYQPRKEFSDEALQELAQSIKQQGIITPITVEPIGDGGYYIIAGERRTRAAKIAGLDKIPAYVRHFSDEKKLQAALIENIQRENLNPMEEAAAYQQIIQMNNFTQDELSRVVGKNRSTITNSLRLLKLPREMQQALSDGKISSGHARAILSLKDENEQKNLFEKIISNSLSVRDAETLATGNSASPAKKPKKPFSSQKPGDADFERIAQDFMEALDAKITMKGNFNKGTIQIKYFSKDSLDFIYEKIMK